MQSAENPLIEKFKGCYHLHIKKKIILKKSHTIVQVRWPMTLKIYIILYRHSGVIQGRGRSSSLEVCTFQRVHTETKNWYFACTFTSGFFTAILLVRY